MAPFYGWVSNASRPQSHYEETVYFLPLDVKISHSIYPILKKKITLLTVSKSNIVGKYFEIFRNIARNISAQLRMGKQPHF